MAAPLIEHKDNIGESIEQVFSLLLQEVESPLVTAFYGQGVIFEGKMNDLLIDTTGIQGQLTTVIARLDTIITALGTANAHLAAIETNTGRIP